VTKKIAPCGFSLIAKQKVYFFLGWAAKFYKVYFSNAKDGWKDYSRKVLNRHLGHAKFRLIKDSTRYKSSLCVI